MMNGRRSICLFVLLTSVGGLAQGCGTGAPPPAIYVLGHPPAGEPGTVSRLNAETVEVRPARVPDYLDSTDILTRGEAGAIVASQSGRWGERFSMGVTRAVASVLTSKLPDVAVTTTPRPEEPRWRVWIDVDTLDVRPQQSSTLVANWGIVDRESGKTVANERDVFSEKGSFRSDPEIVSVVNHEVTEVADHISGVLRPLAAGGRQGEVKLGSR